MLSSQLRAFYARLVTPAETINRALHGAGAAVTAAHLTEVTDGSQTALHSHASGGGAGGASASLEFYGAYALAVSPGGSPAAVALPLDTAAEAFVNWLDAGISINDAKDGLVLAAAGRYRITWFVQITRDTTPALFIPQMPWPTLNPHGVPFVVPAAADYPAAFGYAQAIVADSVDTFPAAAELQFKYTTLIDGVATGLNLQYSLIQVEYLGPAPA